MKLNEKMKNLLDKSNIKQSKEIKFTNKSLFDLLFPNFTCIDDFVFISSNIQVCKDDFLRSTRNYRDKTGYEAYNTETLINVYVDDSELYASDIVPVALNIAKVWSITLKTLTPDNRFCFIISCSGKLVTLRFHKYRDDEDIWLSGDLEEYNQPVCYMIL